MKLLCLLFLLLNQFLFLGQNLTVENSTEKKGNLLLENVHNVKPIKLIEETNYQVDFKFGKLRKKLISMETKRFGHSGIDQYYECLSSFSKDKFHERSCYQWDTLGRLVYYFEGNADSSKWRAQNNEYISSTLQNSVRTYYEKRIGEEKTTTISRYDNLGNICENIEIKNGDTLSYKHYQYMYDFNRRLVESYELYYFDTISKTKYFYNEVDTLIKKEVSKKYFLEWTSYDYFIYDERGLLILEHKNSNSPDGGINEIQYQYDAFRRITQKTFQPFSSSPKVESLLYDINGLLLQEIHLNSSKLMRKVVYEYDSYRNLSRKVYYRDSIISEIVSYNYQYDQYKNWICLTVSLNGKSDYLVERKISYF